MKYSRFGWGSLAATWFLACAPAAKAPIGYDLEPLPTTSLEKERPAEKVADDVVARAAGPVRVIRLSDGAELSGSVLARELLGFDAVCAGEEHTSAPQHYGELWLLDLLIDNAPNLGLELGAGFEIWQAQDQGVLSAFAAGDIEEPRLLNRTKYAQHWGYSFAYYRPFVARAREASLPLVGLNASSEVPKKVSTLGLDSLDKRTEAKLPELDLTDAAHRNDFERRMHDHPGVSPEDLDKYYAAQVVWDETMADNAARWLKLHAPVRRLLILAGQAHCQRTAIPKRLVRRGASRVAALLLGTAAPKDDASETFDYALIVGAPKP